MGNETQGDSGQGCIIFVIIIIALLLLLSQCDNNNSYYEESPEQYLQDSLDGKNDAVIEEYRNNGNSWE